MAVLDWLQQLLGGGDPEAAGAAQASTAMQPMTQPWLDKVLSGEMARGGIEDVNDAFASGDPVALAGSFGPAPSVTLPRLWHGAARPLEGNRFDPTRLGTGEGYHAEGAGGYASESRPVAEWYQKTYGEYPPEVLEQARAAMAKEFPLTYGPGLGGEPKYPNDIIKAAQHWTDFEAPKPGALYEMAYHGADTDHFLRWDLPLKDQSAYVRKNLGRLGITEDGTVPYTYGQGSESATGTRSMADMTGRDIYEHLGRENALDPAQPLGGTTGDPAVAALLRRHGLSGTRYPASDFPGNEGKFNYSVFDPQVLTILRRLGLLPPLAAGGLLAAPGPGEAGQP